VSAADGVNTRPRPLAVDRRLRRRLQAPGPSQSRRGTSKLVGRAHSRQPRLLLRRQALSRSQGDGLALQGDRRRSGNLDRPPLLRTGRGGSSTSSPKPAVQPHAAIADNSSEFRPSTFTSTLEPLAVQQHRIRAGRPTSTAPSSDRSRRSSKHPGDPPWPAHSRRSSTALAGDPPAVPRPTSEPPDEVRSLE
jgi:hypothetical protein